MAYFRKLPSGKWQATIRGADGRKHTKTDPLKKVVKDWANDEESKLAQGRWRNPRLAKQTVDEWLQRWLEVRIVEAETQRLDRTTLRVHVVPQWAMWRLADITALDVKAWVSKMQKAGCSPHTIRRSYNLFSAMMGDAVTAGILPSSPCGRHINNRPEIPRKLPAWFTREQVRRIREQLTPKHSGHSVMVEMMCWIGTRWGESAAMCGAERTDGNPVDFLRGRVRIVGTLTQDGKWKAHPKTSASRREIPIPPHVLAEMSALLIGRPADSYLYLSPRGRPMSASNWREIWYRAIDDATKAGARAKPALEPVPRLDPHDCRHTAASWLAQEGVPLYDIRELLGHGSGAITERYAHLKADAYDRVRQVWTTMAHEGRTGPGKIAT